MLIYEVNLAVDPGAAPGYAVWLRGHIPEVLASDGFLSAAWLDVEAEPGDPCVRWCVQYHVRDRTALDAYFAGPAQRLRADGQEKFGGGFEAARRVLTLREELGG